MKRLYLVRHAKSSWSDPSLSDKKRPLNGRGKKNAPEMGIRLKKQSILPDILISSPAKRAKNTAKKIAKEIGYPKEELLLSDTLYHTGLETLLEGIQKLDNSLNSVMIFGHNPGFTDFANALCDINIYNIPTCGIVAIDFKTDFWTEIEMGKGELVFFDYPKKKSSA